MSSEKAAVPPPPAGFEMVPAPPPGFTIVGQGVPVERQMDRRRGAPAMVRAAVGAANTAEDRLATIQRFYPDARPYDGDNFVFTDPETKRPTLYNEDNAQVFGVPVPSLGDLASIGPEMAELVGGAIGGTVAAVPAAAGAPVTGGASALAVPAGVGLGAAAGREAYQRLASAVLGTQDTRGLGTRLTDAAVTVGANAVAQQLPGVVGGAVRRTFGAGDTGAAAAAMDFARAGVDPPTAGVLTGNRGMQMVDKLVENTPGGASVMQGSAERSLGQVKQAADFVARRLATADGANPAGAVLTPQGAGEVIEDGVKAAGGRFADRIQDLGNRMYSSIGADRRVPGAALADLRQSFTDAVTADPGLRTTHAKLLGELSDVLDGGKQTGGVTFGALHRLRMKVGEALPNPDASNYRGVMGKDLERYYAALTKDMAAAADDAGPAAAQALKLHDRYIRLNQTVNMPTLNGVDRVQTAESAFRWAMAGSRDGGTKLYRLRRNLRPEEWDGVAGAAFQQLGRARPGAAGATALGDAVEDFSVGTFLTNWNRLAPEGRRALFGGTRYADIAPAMDDLARVVARMKDAEKMANPSGTARHVLMGLGVGAAGSQAIVNHDPAGGAMMLAGSVVAPRMAAKLMTSPRFIRWLSATTAATERNPNRLPVYLSRLAAIGDAEPHLRDALGQYVDSFRSTSSNSGASNATGGDR